METFRSNPARVSPARMWAAPVRAATVARWFPVQIRLCAVASSATNKNCPTCSDNRRLMVTLHPYTLNSGHPSLATVIVSDPSAHWLSIGFQNKRFLIFFAVEEDFLIKTQELFYSQEFSLNRYLVESFESSQKAKISHFLSFKCFLSDMFTVFL